MFDKLSLLMRTSLTEAEIVVKDFLLSIISVFLTIRKTSTGPNVSVMNGGCFISVLLFIL